MLFSCGGNEKFAGVASQTYSLHAREAARPHVARFQELFMGRSIFYVSNLTI
jgi:hypothetical protein